jgi:hypothetical protein
MFKMPLATGVTGVSPKSEEDTFDADGRGLIYPSWKAYSYNTATSSLVFNHGIIRPAVELYGADCGVRNPNTTSAKRTAHLSIRSTPVMIRALRNVMCAIGFCLIRQSSALPIVCFHSKPITFCWCDEKNLSGRR